MRAWETAAKTAAHGGHAGAMPDFGMERSLGGIVCGIDEAGRGPWAGPVVAAAVVLDARRMPDALLNGLDDSKKIGARKRETLFEVLMAEREAGRVHVGVGEASVAEIDDINILQATYRAMIRAVDGMGCTPGHAIVDGNGLPKLPCPARAVPKGDSRCFSIAAASIVAKVTRDRTMAGLHALFPDYGFATNMGYGTKVHQAALARLGPTEHHRRSFAPVRRLLERATISGAQESGDSPI